MDISKPFRLLIKPMMKKGKYEVIDKFIHPLIEFLEEKRKEVIDWLLYGAPLAMYFDVSPYDDPADPFIAATYAILAAEALGPGSCMIGSISPMLKCGGEKVKEKYGINLRNQPRIVIIVDYPAVKYRYASLERLCEGTFY